ncbi:MAG: hypothetical protein WA814_06670 [Candidatus Baltobacteraceae bacterium]
MHSRFIFSTAAAGGFILGAALLMGTPGARLAAAAATPPPTPPPITTPVTPQPNASLMPVDATPTPLPFMTPRPTKGSATPSPPPNVRKGLEGVWEVQIQHPNSTDYTHFVLKQDGTALTGTYVDAKGKRYPLAGSVDGQAIRLIVTMPNGTTLLAEAKLDGTTDMLGQLTTSNGVVYFTAAYRPKEKWIENVNPSPGGMGGGAGGGYTPP